MASNLSGFSFASIQALGRDSFVSSAPQHRGSIMSQVTTQSDMSSGDSSRRSSVQAAPPGGRSSSAGVPMGSNNMDTLATSTQDLISKLEREKANIEENLRLQNEIAQRLQQGRPNDTAGHPGNNGAGGHMPRSISAPVGSNNFPQNSLLLQQQQAAQLQMMNPLNGMPMGATPSNLMAMQALGQAQLGPNMGGVNANAMANPAMSGMLNANMMAMMQQQPLQQHQQQLMFRSGGPNHGIQPPPANNGANTQRSNNDSLSPGSFRW